MDQVFTDCRVTRLQLRQSQLQCLNAIRPIPIDASRTLSTCARPTAVSLACTLPLTPTAARQGSGVFTHSVVGLRCSGLAFVAAQVHLPTFGAAFGIRHTRRARVPQVCLVPPRPPVPSHATVRRAAGPTKPIPIPAAPVWYQLRGGRESTLDYLGGRDTRPCCHHTTQTLQTLCCTLSSAQ
jgi:hypothetical protein